MSYEGRTDLLTDSSRRICPRGAGGVVLERQKSMLGSDLGVPELRAKRSGLSLNFLMNQPLTIDSVLRRS